jgi:hypothetical protein
MTIIPKQNCWVLEEDARARHFYERQGWILVPDTILERQS